VIQVDRTRKEAAKDGVNPAPEPRRLPSAVHNSGSTGRRGRTSNQADRPLTAIGVTRAESGALRGIPAGAVLVSKPRHRRNLAAAEPTRGPFGPAVAFLWGVEPEQMAAQQGVGGPSAPCEDGRPSSRPLRFTLNQKHKEI